MLLTQPPSDMSGKVRIRNPSSWTSATHVGNQDGASAFVAICGVKQLMKDPPIPLSPSVPPSSVTLPFKQINLKNGPLPQPLCVCVCVVYVCLSFKERMNSFKKKITKT